MVSVICLDVSLDVWASDEFFVKLAGGCRGLVTSHGGCFMGT